ncbi:MAG: hypothetical protein KDF64_15180 [Geminicoccaceae bacterium]|nr:hypothetical protein [Geminicoccaceae bacterium]
MTRTSEPPERWTPISGFLAALVMFELLNIFFDIPFVRQLSWIAALAYFALAVPRIGFREHALLAICCILTLTVIVIGRMEVLARALDQAVFLTAFIQLLGLLREAAITSPAIRDCGLHLTRQPPQRRYLAIHAGSHLFGMILNFGAISLLGPLIQEGVRASDGDERIRGIRERRQLSAMIRGFSWIVVWAPSSVTQALLLTLFPDADPLRSLMLGIGTALVMMLVGWFEDRHRFRKAPQRPRADAGSLSPRTLRHLAGILLMLLTLTFAIRWIGSVATVQALMLAAPIALTLWVFVQNGALGPVRGASAVLGRWHRVLKVALPAGAREGVMLGASGFIGIVTGALTPASTIASFIGDAGIDPALFLFALPLLILLGGQIALSPVMMVVFLGSVIAAFPHPPADPALVAFALSSGWALTMTAAPNATGALMLSRITGIPSTTLTWRWNGRFTLMALAFLFAVFFTMTRG